MATFDPNFPPEHAELTSAGYRNQFNGLNEKIDAVPAGITQETLDDAIAGVRNDCALKTPDVSPLMLTISDPPTQAELEAVRDKVNQLIYRLNGMPLP